MAWVIDQIITLIGLGLLMLIGAALIAPLESLGWWAGWSGNPPGLDDVKDKDKKPVADGPEPPPEKEYYIVYLSGIGVASADSLAKDEIDFINQLTEELPDAQLITDVFPYSVNNNPLTGERALTPLWRRVRAIQTQNPDSLLAMILINVRNLLQVAVSADPRYGPIYSLGVAQEIARSLAKHGYRLSSGKPVYLIGFSGGGQVSVGSSTYLSPILKAPVYIVSVGGVISDDPGIRHVKHLTHFYGDKDPIQKAGEVLWSGRWPMMVQSAWNRAKSGGKIDMINLGPMAHNAWGGYYDIRVKFDDGQNYCEVTTRAIKEAIVAQNNQATSSAS
jgi:hypothetical protein